MKKNAKVMFKNDGSQTTDRSEAVITLTLSDKEAREHFDQPTADEAAIKAAGKEVVDWVEDRTDDTVTDASAKPIVTMTKDDFVIKQPKGVAAFSADNADDALGQLVDFNKRHFVQPQVQPTQQQQPQQPNQQQPDPTQQPQQPDPTQQPQQPDPTQQSQQPDPTQQSQQPQQQQRQPRRDPFDFSKAFHEETQEDLIAQNNDQIDFFLKQLQGQS